MCLADRQAEALAPRCATPTRHTVRGTVASDARWDARPAKPGFRLGRPSCGCAPGGSTRVPSTVGSAERGQSVPKRMRESCPPSSRDGPEPRRFGHA